MRFWCRLEVVKPADSTGLGWGQEQSLKDVGSSPSQSFDLEPGSHALRYSDAP
jgi:hypothetical protein